MLFPLSSRAEELKHLKPLLRGRERDRMLCGLVRCGLALGRTGSYSEEEEKEGGRKW